MSLYNKNKLYCFTPLASLLTFVVEFILAAYVIIRYRHTLFGRISALLLILLGTFQLSEYFICTTSHTDIATRIGYAAITFLPILSIHLIAIATKKTALTLVGYIAASIITGVILFVPGVFEYTNCSGKFVIFFNKFYFSLWFGAYYLFFILAGIFLAVSRLYNQHYSKRLLKWFLIGYASFLVPTAALFVLIEATRIAVGSIMCGFAVLLAIILVVKILPIYHEEIEKKK